MRVSEDWSMLVYCTLHVDGIIRHALQLLWSSLLCGVPIFMDVALLHPQLLTIVAIYMAISVKSLADKF